MRATTSVDGETKVVGVIGWPVKHSLSPPMQNAALAELGLNWVYVPFEVHPEQLAEAIAAVRALRLVGLNVTVPHKGGVAGLVDELGDSARVLGAVNTVVNRDGHLAGHNTDGEGFLRSLAEAGETVRGRRVALIGAGGSARAVAYAVMRDGAARLTIINRTPERAAQVADLVRENTGGEVLAAPLESSEAEGAVREAEIVVDSTPCGMYPETEVPPVIPAEWLHEGQCVCDLVYTPRDTVLLRAARERGARTVEGSGMLVHQGAIALELWTGKRAPVGVMREALLTALAARQGSRVG
jgi:shikimate dehydrogenase